MICMDEIDLQSLISILIMSLFYQMIKTQFKLVLEINIIY